MTVPFRECQAVRYAPRKACSETPPKFRVVYRGSDGKVRDQHPACFTHAMAEADRHATSGGMARCDVEEVR